MEFRIRDVVDGDFVFPVNPEEVSIRIVQILIQSTEINYDELSTNVGHKIALAVKQAMTNKSAVLA